MNAEKVERLEELIRQILPPQDHQFAALAPGVARERLEGVEQEFDIQLPRTTKDFYLTRNGQASHVLFMFLGYRLHPIEQIAESYRRYCRDAKAPRAELYDEVSDPPFPREVKATLGNVKWLPIGDNGGSTTLFIDLDPSDFGELGQLLAVNVELGEVKIVASSIDELVDRVIAGIEGGDLSYDEDAGVLA